MKNKKKLNLAANLIFVKNLLKNKFKTPSPHWLKVV